MQIVHVRFRVIFPCRAGKTGAPVIRLFSVLRRTPDIVIPVGIVRGLPAFHKPAVLVGGMVHHQVHDQADAPLMGRRKHFIEIVHGAELFHDRLIIADIIPVVIIGGLIDRGEPDDINAQFFEIIQFGSDSSDIPDPVSVAVAEASRIDLINDAFFPPFFLHDRFSFLSFPRSSALQGGCIPSYAERPPVAGFMYDCTL